MDSGWRSFWGSTFSYFTLDGYNQAISYLLPNWIEEALEWLGRLLTVSLALIVMLAMFPLVMARMLYLTPRRYRKTVLKEQPNDNR